MPKRLIFLVVLFFAGALAVSGATINDFLVNDDTGSTNQYYPDIAVDDSGNFVIVWDDERCSSHDVYVQKYNSSGAPLGANFKVNETFGDRFVFPAVAMNRSGGFVVTYGGWMNSNNIYARIFDSTGTAQDSAFKVNDIVGYSSDRYFPDVAIDNSNNFIIIWEDEHDFSHDIYAQRYNSSGATIGSNFTLAVPAGYEDSAVPAIAMNGAGSFVTVWGSYSPYESPLDYGDIWAQRFDSSGGYLGLRFQVNDDTGSAGQRTPAIAMDNQGDFVIVWEDERSSTDDIYAQRYNSSGAPLGSNFRVNEIEGVAFPAVTPAVAMSDSGSFVTTWQEPAWWINKTVYARNFNSNGTAESNEYFIPDSQYVHKLFGQQTPAVAIKGSKIYFAWADNRRGNWDIYAKVVDWNWLDVKEDQKTSLPNSFILSQNYPNPFNASTKIEFSLKNSGFVSLNIYDILGRKVKTLVSGDLHAGYRSVLWDGKDDSGNNVASGAYFCKIKAGNFFETKKIMLLK